MDWRASSSVRGAPMGGGWARPLRGSDQRRCELEFERHRRCSPAPAHRRREHASVRRKNSGSPAHGVVWWKMITPTLDPELRDATDR